MGEGVELGIVAESPFSSPPVLEVGRERREKDADNLLVQNFQVGA